MALWRIADLEISDFLFSLNFKQDSNKHGILRGIRIVYS